MSHTAMLCAALLDVGGTLWPDRLAPQVDLSSCLQQFGCLLPGVEPSRALATLREEIRRGLAEADHSGTYGQDMRGLIGRALRSLGICPAGLDTTALRRALCAPASPGIHLFPGAEDLLKCLHTLGLRCVITSNVQVRGADEYWRDFTDLGVAHLIDAIVTSLDVGFRKPHPAFFAAALAAADCEPAACVMIGNSEMNDIQPAVALGMRAVRVAIEERLPESTAAHALVDNLDAAIGIVRRWAAGAA